MPLFPDLKMSLSWRVLGYQQLLRRLGAFTSSLIFIKKSREYLENLFWIIMLTVYAWILIIQGLSCFCLDIVLGGDDYSAVYLFGRLVDWLLDNRWIKGSTNEPAIQGAVSFSRERAEATGTAFHEETPNKGPIMFSCVSQAGFRGRHNL